MQLLLLAKNVEIESEEVGRLVQKKEKLGSLIWGSDIHVSLQKGDTTNFDSWSESQDILDTGDECWLSLTS